jgi:hypothetical protein
MALNLPLSSAAGGDNVPHPDARGEAGCAGVLDSSLSPERKVTMDAFWEFVTSWTFMIIMAVLLAALIGLLLFLRNRRTDD